MSKLLQSWFMNTSIWCQNRGAELSAPINEDNLKQGVQVKREHGKGRETKEQVKKILIQINGN